MHLNKCDFQTIDTLPNKKMSIDNYIGEQANLLKVFLLFFFIAKS